MLLIYLILTIAFIKDKIHKLNQFSIPYTYVLTSKLQYRSPSNLYLRMKTGSQLFSVVVSLYS